jgi:hypothetical protein
VEGYAADAGLGFLEGGEGEERDGCGGGHLIYFGLFRCGALH